MSDKQEVSIYPDAAFKDTWMFLAHLNDFERIHPASPPCVQGFIRLAQRLSVHRRMNRKTHTMRWLHPLTFLFAILLFSACDSQNALGEPPLPTNTPVPNFTSTPAGSDDAEAYHNRGVAHAELGRYAEAIAEYDEAIRLRPDYAKAYFGRGNARARLGRHAEAIADYDEAIRLQPDLAEAYYNRGLAYASLGWYEEAIADYDEAIRQRPDYAEAYNNRGVAHAELGRYAEAIAEYDEAIRLRPDLCRDLQQSGRCLRRSWEIRESYRRL